MKPHDQIKALFALVPKREGWCRPEYVVDGTRNYRGKRRFVAGYSHSRLYSHHASGLCYDRILGYGDTQDEAIAMMERKLKK